MIRRCRWAGTVESRADLPSIGQGMRTPMLSAIVGSTSTVRSGLSLTRALRWPGAFTKNGTGAMSSTFAERTRRRSCPRRKLMP